MTRTAASSDDSHQPAPMDESTTLVRLRAEAPVEAQALVEELFQTLAGFVGAV